MFLLVIVKHGGFDSRNQSRLRTSFMSRLTFENRWECPSCQDQLFFSRLRFLKSRLFSQDWRVIFLSRLSRRVKICWDTSRLSRFVESSWDLSRNLYIVEAFWVWKWWKVLTDWEISTWKYKNPRTSRSRQTVEKRQNFQILTNFSISIKTFWSGHWCWDKIEKSRSWPRFLDCQDALFDADEIFLTVKTHSLTTPRSRLSIETNSRQIETPMLSNCLSNTLHF